MRKVVCLFVVAAVAVVEVRRGLRGGKLIKRLGEKRGFLDHELGVVGAHKALMLFGILLFLLQESLDLAHVLVRSDRAGGVDEVPARAPGGTGHELSRAAARLAPREKA